MRRIKTSIPPTYLFKQMDYINLEREKKKKTLLKERVVMKIQKKLKKKKIQRDRRKIKLDALDPCYKFKIEVQTFIDLYVEY